MAIRRVMAETEGSLAFQTDAKAIRIAVSNREAAMLDLRPNCECCDRDLPPESRDARICTYECTFCADCAEGRLGGECPNCRGELVQRPVRPPAKLFKDPASSVRVLKPHPACA
jgi:hypothetical protein